MNPLSNVVLRLVLSLTGLAIVFLGLNVGFGGIETLGWQGGQVDFLTITDPAVFAIRDNHVRFVGGVWLGVGLLFLAGAYSPRALKTVLIALTGLIFVGGLARLSAADASLLTGSAIAPSLLLELVLFPLLGFWIARAAG